MDDRAPQIQLTAQVTRAVSLVALAFGSVSAYAGPKPTPSPIPVAVKPAAAVRAVAVPALPPVEAEWLSPPASLQPALSYLWVDAKGNARHIEWQTKSEIEWPEGGASPAAARVWLELPVGWNLVSAESKVCTREPAQNEPWPGRSLQLRLGSEECSVDVILADANKKPRQETLVINSATAKSVYFEDSSCGDLGIRFFKLAGGKPSNSRSPFVGARCKKAGGLLEVAIDRWGTEPVEEVEGLKKIKVPGNLVIFRTPLPARPENNSLRLGKIRVGDAESGVFLTPNSLTRFHFTMGLGATYISYQEPANQISLSETGLTGKIAASYFLGKRFDTSASAFATLLPLTVSPTGTPSVRFWGLNARLGYALPWPRSITLSLSGGYYVMGMSTAGNYGIAEAMGPQVFLVLSNAGATKREYFIYLKLSGLSNGVSIFTSSHEAAIGGGYALGHPWGRLLQGTLDLSQLSFTTADETQSLHYVTGSLGAQLRL